MATGTPIINEPEAGPSSLPSTRTVSPDPEGRTLRRPASHGRLAKLMLPGRSRSSSSASQQETTATAYADEVASGRTTPEQRRRTTRAAAASLLANDGRYKKYAAQVDKALQTFESVNEWADFISFLSRLLKTLQSPSPAYNEIPRKLIVAKRLAQCLNPALPSGVHQRALDVYAHIFSAIGVDGLRRDLLIWSSGLFPFFQFAATSVRPILINIYETYYLPLGSDLRPATKALILALLPGVEEETGDFFDRVSTLLQRMSKAISPGFFLQNIFLVLISNPTSRLAGLNYLSKTLTRPPEAVSSSDTGLIIRGVAAVLEDQNSLVQRAGLDLLLRAVALDGTVFSDANDEEKALLVRAASGVVLQRELSLSRRVYTWFLGTDDNHEVQAKYFQSHGLGILSSTLLGEMENPLEDAQRPFKVFLSLLDRWEIGAPLSERLGVPALQAIRRLSLTGRISAEEATTTGTAVYDAVEPLIIWRAIFHSLSGHSTEGDELLRWILAYLPQKDEEVVNLHIPLVLTWLLEQGPKYRDTQLARLLFRHIPSALLQRSPSSDDVSRITTELYNTSSIPDRASESIILHTLPSLAKTILDLVGDKSLEVNDAIDCVAIATDLVDADAVALSTKSGDTWVQNAMRRLDRDATFPVVEAVSVLVLKLCRSGVFETKVGLSHESAGLRVIEALFRFLSPQFAIFHARVVQLIWDFNALTQLDTLENVICAQLSTSNQTRFSNGLQAFGVLWRLTDDSLLPGEMFNTSIALVLDTLKSSDPDRQRAGETWMRCNLGSYFRVVDPILCRLIDPSASSGDVAGRGSVDLPVVQYQVESLTTLFRFGGKSLSKACQSTQIGVSVHPSLVSRAEKASITGDYLSSVILVLVSHLKSANDGRRSIVERPQIIRLQNSILELLQLVISRQDLNRPSLNLIRRTLVDQLNIATETHTVTLQSKMLHILHSTVSAISTMAKTHRRSTSLTEGDEMDTIIAHLAVDGIRSTSNRPVMQHWVDFVIIMAPQFASRPGMVHTLITSLSEQLRSVMIELRNSFDKSSPTSLSDTEPVMLLSCIERLLSVDSVGARPAEGRVGNEGGSGIFGLVSGVFVADATDERPRTDDSPSQDSLLETLLVTWTITTPTDSSGPTSASRARIMSRIRTKSKEVSLRIFKTHPSSVIGVSVKAWVDPSPDVETNSIFHFVDSLAPSAQRVVEVITDGLSPKQSRSLSFSAIASAMAFLEAYIRQLEAPIAVQIWNTMFSFSREMITSAGTPNAKAQLYPLLKCITALGQTVATTSALEDKKLRRDLQDVYPKLVDAVTANAARVVSASPLLSDEKGVLDGQESIYDYLADGVIPNVRSFMGDNDRATGICLLVSANIVTPAFKQSRVDVPIIRIIHEMTKIPSATRSWRLIVGDAFNDNRFFRCRPDEITWWKPLICALMDGDKERFADLLGRITAAPSANIFTNREQEMITRSLNLRRLSFVILAAEQNHFLTQLPAIQEKLVDILRTNVVSPRVHSEVYLCLRVLMCRISPQHLTNFWPVILAELLRVFETIMEDTPADNSESLQLALAACKFLDLLLVIQSEDFQIHQWMFVTDTTDAAYPPEEYSAEAIMDIISEILSEQMDSKAPPLELATSEGGLRKPRLSETKSITSLRQLQPFFSRASIDTFEGVYSNAGVDWPSVEAGLTGEIFYE